MRRQQGPGPIVKLGTNPVAGRSRSSRQECRRNCSRGLGRRPGCARITRSRCRGRDRNVQLLAGLVRGHRARQQHDIGGLRRSSVGEPQQQAQPEARQARARARARARAPPPAPAATSVARQIALPARHRGSAQARDNRSQEGIERYDIGTHGRIAVRSGAAVPPRESLPSALGSVHRGHYEATDRSRRLISATKAAAAEVGYCEEKVSLC